MSVADREALVELLETVYQQYHYDFRAYAREPLARGVARTQATLGEDSIAQLCERVRGDPLAFTELLRHLTVMVSDLFRDPDHYRALREQVVPHLETYPQLRVWVAGCGSGEEAYSIAIVLEEAGLLGRARIYATDIDEESLAVARRGVYAHSRASGFEQRYRAAGGRASLGDYFTANATHVAFDERLRQRIVFFEHSLSTDAAFAEFQLVSCRNVLIYFDRALRHDTIALFRKAMCSRAFLALGADESLVGSQHDEAFEPVAAGQRIYRLKANR